MDLMNMLIASQYLQKNSGSSGGSSAGSSAEKEVNFYDYDGTLLHSYSLDEAAALTELPALPTREGLICQGWNYDLEMIKSYDRSLDVGATYITDDGKTRLYITIDSEERMDMLLNLSQTVANGVIVDWGDGSATQTLESVGGTSVTHTYASGGEYMISLDVAEGCILSFGDGSSKCPLMGDVNTKTGTRYRRKLRKVAIGKRVQSISEAAFTHSGLFTSVTIPEGVTDIGADALYSCYSLKCVVFPKGITSIGNSAFANCYSLEKIVFPKGITNIGNNIFNYCNSLKNIVIPKGVTSMGYNAFGYCNLLEKIVISEGVTMISNNIFQGCSLLTNVVIPEGVTSIGNSAFSNCYTLEKIVFPKEVTSIGTYAFSNCCSLEKIVFPKGITNIGNNAFNACSAVKIYDFTNSITIPTLANTNAFPSISADCEILVPAALYDEWIAATNWSTYADRIKAV